MPRPLQIVFFAPQSSLEKQLERNDKENETVRDKMGPKISPLPSWKNKNPSATCGAKPVRENTYMRFILMAVEKTTEIAKDLKVLVHLKAQDFSKSKAWKPLPDSHY